MKEKQEKKNNWIEKLEEALRKLKKPKTKVRILKEDPEKKDRYIMRSPPMKPKKPGEKEGNGYVLKRGGEF